MARPRRPYTGVDTPSLSEDKWHLERARALGVETGALPAARSSLAAVGAMHPTPRLSGHDAICCGQLLDGLLMMNEQVELRAHFFAAYLNACYPAYFWGPVQTGRLLNALWENIEALQGADGLLRKGVDSRGAFYTINLTSESLTLVYQAARELRGLAQEQTARARLGIPVTPLGDDGTVFDLLPCFAAPE